MHSKRRGRCRTLALIQVVTGDRACYAVLCCCRPFHDENQVRLFMKIKKGTFSFHPQYWSTISEDAKVQVHVCKRVHICCVCRYECYSHLRLHV
jgi:hypothetical protein